MGNQIYKEISKFAEMQRDEIKREESRYVWIRTPL